MAIPQGKLQVEHDSSEAHTAGESVQFAAAAAHPGRSRAAANATEKTQNDRGLGRSHTTMVIGAELVEL